MSPEQETCEDAKTRLHDLEHAVAQAQQAAADAPGDDAARRKLDMTIAIRDAGQKALQQAEAKLASTSNPLDPR